MSRQRRPSYSPEETQALIEHYEHLREMASTGRGLEWLARRSDLDTALEQIPVKFYEVVLLHGLIGYSLVETAQLLQISHQAVSKRYRQGVEEVNYTINGGA